jgi:hypothetical protein
MFPLFRYATVAAYRALTVAWNESLVSHLVSHGSLEGDLIAWNWAVAYAVEPKGTGT